MIATVLAWLQTPETVSRAQLLGNCLATLCLLWIAATFCHWWLDERNERRYLQARCKLLDRQRQEAESEGAVLADLLGRMTRDQLQRPLQ